MNPLKTVLKAPVVNSEEILDLTLKRETLTALKRRYEEMEGIVKASEQALIAKVGQGAEIPHGFNLVISQKEIRHVSWKTEFAAVAGTEAVDSILSRTEPTIYRHLVIKKAV